MIILFWIFFGLAITSLIGFIVSMSIKTLRWSSMPAIMSLLLSTFALLCNIINLCIKVG